MVLFVDRTSRGGKSAGTWEPSSQKVFKVAERNWRFERISRICVISRRILTFLRRISAKFLIISFNQSWIHGIYTKIPIFLQYEHKCHVFYAERNQSDNAVPRKHFNFFHLCPSTSASINDRISNTNIFQHSVTMYLRNIVYHIYIYRMKKVLIIYF